MRPIPESLAVARLQLSFEQPYLSPVLFRLQPVEVADVGLLSTLGVDKGYRLYYHTPMLPGGAGLAASGKHPAIPALTHQELVAVLVHEVAHLLHCHHTRLAHIVEDVVTEDGEPISVANWGGDLAVNSGPFAPDKLPEWCLFPKKFGFPDGLTAEEYCELIRQKAQANGKCKFPTLGRGQPWNGSCGSCSGGKKKGYELPDDDKEAPAVGEAEAESLAKEVAERVREAGNVPAKLRRWADQLLTPPVKDWRAVLRKFAKQLAPGSDDATYSRPSRRFGGRIVAPGSFSVTAEAVLIGDTSGSMSAADLAVIYTVGAGILKAMGARLRCIASDCCRKAVQTVAKAQGISLEGGGGTDMGLLIEQAAQLRPRPDVIVCVTDCYTPWPASAPSVPVIVVDTQPGKGHGPVPAWAKHIEVLTQAKEESE